MFSAVYRVTQKDFYARGNVSVEVRRDTVYSDRTQLPRHVGEIRRPTDTSRFHIPAGRYPASLPQRCYHVHKNIFELLCTLLET
jgi:hypothetical protein